MPTTRLVPITILIVFSLAGFLLSGCSAFESSKRMDMTPFSENAGVLFVEAAKVSRPFNWQHLKPPVDLPEAKNMFQNAAILYRGFSAITNYSNQLVALNTAKMTDTKKNANLALYISEAFQRVADKGILDTIGMDQGSLDTVLADIKGSKTYLDGIAAASPLVNAIVMTMGDRLTRIQEQTPAIAEAMGNKVEDDYAPRRANFTNLVSLRTASMRAMTLLYEARLGDQTALDSLLREDPSIQEFIPSRDKVTGKGMATAETYLADRLTKLDTFIHQLDPDVQLYMSKRRELEEWRRNIDERIKIARDALMVWSQSHRNLGMGIPVPPLIDVTGFATGLMKKVAPIP